MGDRLSASEVAAITASIALEIGIEPAEIQSRRVTTTRHDNPHLEHDRADRHPREYWMAKRAYPVGGLTRFVSATATESVKRSRAALDPRNPALKEGRTIFPTRVFDGELYI